jgi:hypothetical protein
MSDAVVQASTVEVPLEDTYKTHFGTIEDLSTLWRLHELVTKHIRKLEKTSVAKKRRVRDPNAPKKEASPQLLAWNEQIHRIQALSEKDGESKVPYNHALKIGGALKAAGKLAISKDGNIVPTDEEVEEAVAHYREHNDIKVVEPKAAKKVVASEAKAPSTPAPASAQAQPVKAKTTTKPKQEEVEQDMETYSFIIGGKSYERGDIDGKAFIWDAKGTYMGVYNEKTKKFDTSIPDPTIV